MVRSFQDLSADIFISRCSFRSSALPLSGAPLMLKPGYMFGSDEKGERTTEAVMSEMISMVTHNT